MPSIISNITVPLLGLADVAIVGHIGDAAYIGAIAVGSMLFNVAYWLFGFLRMGTSGMTSQALGRRDLAESMRLLMRALSIGLGIGLLFVLLQWPLIEGGLRLMHPQTDVLELARTYCRICIWGAPAVLALYGFTGWLVGMQNTRLPMAVAIGQNVINILASLFFVFVLGMDVQGVALGTVLAQWCGLLLMAAGALKGYRRLLHYPWRNGLLQAESLKRFFTLNRDIFLRTLCLVAVNLFFTAAGAREGTLVLAVNTLLMTLFTIYSYFMDGFAYAAEALAGKYYGAGNREALRTTVRGVFRWGGVMVVLFSFLYMVGGNRFLSLLTSDAQVVAAADRYFWWAVLIPVAGMAAFLFDGIFVGLTRSRAMLASTFLASLLFFVLYAVLHPVLGNHALWLAFVAYLALRGLVLSVAYFLHTPFRCAHF